MHLGIHFNIPYYLTFLLTWFSAQDQTNPLAQYVPQLSGGGDQMVMNGRGGEKVETMSVDAQTMPPRPRPSTITAHDYNHCTNRCV